VEEDEEEDDGPVISTSQKMLAAAPGSLYSGARKNSLYSSSPLVAPRSPKTLRSSHSSPSVSHRSPYVSRLAGPERRSSFQVQSISTSPLVSLSPIDGVSAERRSSLATSKISRPTLSSSSNNLGSLQQLEQERKLVKQMSDSLMKLQAEEAMLRRQLNKQNQQRGRTNSFTTV